MRLVVPWRRIVGGICTTFESRGVRASECGCWIPYFRVEMAVVLLSLARRAAIADDGAPGTGASEAGVDSQAPGCPFGMRSGTE